MRFKQFILAEAVTDYLPQVFDFLKDEPDDVLVHFSRINKLGMNPNPSHSDPIGLYTFPKPYVMGSKFHTNHSFFTMPYVFVLRPKPGLNVLNLSKLTEPKLTQMLKQMGIDYLDKTHGEKPGHWLWDAIEKSTQNLYGQAKNIAWNKLFNKVNVDALYDSGDSIIHSNEPSQFVFLKPGTWDIVKLFSNASTKGVYDRIALNIINSVAGDLFDQFKIKKSTSGSSMVLNAHGKIKGVIHSLSLKYEDYTSNWYGGKDTGELRFPFSGSLTIYSRYLEKSFEPEVIRLDWSGNKLKETIEPIIQRLKEFIGNKDNYKKDTTHYDVKALSEKVMNVLGFGGRMRYNYDNTWATYNKRYKDKSLINVSVSHYKDKYSLSINLTIKEKEYGSKQIYSQSNENPVEISVKKAHKSYDKAAYKLASMAISNLENAVEVHYNPTPDKNDDWDKWEKAKNGEEFSRLIKKLKAKITK